MLDYRSDRLDYGSMLVPPEGYELDRGVATTFSATLDTLLSIPVALIYAQTLEGRLDQETFQILEAIQQITEKVTVYHHQGKLHVPSNYNRLYAFLEHMLVPVKTESAFTAFHPKVWSLRYVPQENNKPTVYRVMIMSRNLTQDRNWDVATCIEGKVGARQQSRNQPLIDFLGHLNGISPFKDADLFLGDLAHVDFELPEGVDELVFHPIGIPAYTRSPIPKVTAGYAVVISPFIDQSGLENLEKNVSEECYLFSRQHELVKLPESYLTRFAACYQLSEHVVEGERQLDEKSGDLDTLDQDLHAKLFVFEDDQEARVFLGSANATGAALSRNTEFMVECRGDLDVLGVDVLLDDLLGPEPDRDFEIFTLFDPASATGEDSDADQRNALRQLEFNLMNSPLEASLTQSPNGITYDLEIALDAVGIQSVEGVGVFLYPLNRDSTRMIQLDELNTRTFANLKETELTRFLVIRLEAEDSTSQFLRKVEIKGIPKSRHDSIFKSIVDSQKEFFRYLQFLLMDEQEKGDLDDKGKKGKSSSDKDEFAWLSREPVFEHLLIASSRDPQRLRRIDALIDRLRDWGDGEEPIIPPAFLEFWSVFKPLIPAVKEPTRSQ